jgi:hypothetical protein
MKRISLVGWTHLIAIIGAFALILFAGYSAFDSTGQEQAGWDMLLFLSIAVMLILISLLERKANYLLLILVVVCIILGLIFGVYYFFGKQGLIPLAHFWQI